MNRSDFESLYARYLAGELDEAERAEFERAVLDDPELSAEVYADQAVAQAMRPRPRAVPARRRWRWTVPVAVAAAAMALALHLRHPGPETPGPVMRGPVERVHVRGPRGSLPAPPRRFAWLPVEGASSYRVEILDARARVVARLDTRALEVEAPRDVPAQGAWRVVAVDSTGREIAASELVGFSAPSR